MQLEFTDDNASEPEIEALAFDAETEESFELKEPDDSLFDEDD